MSDFTFPGGTEMARRMRALDWSRTPLGPVERWPQSLLTSVSICLDCAFPIVVWWGPELALLYNDDYRAILGPAKDPTVLGQPGLGIGLTLVRRLAVLLDIGQPGMDGYEVARRARALPEGADVALVDLGVLHSLLATLAARREARLALAADDRESEPTP